LSIPRPRDDLVGRQDAHLHRQHQREEDQPEEQHAEGEAEIDDGEGRQQRDAILPMVMPSAMTSELSSISPNRHVAATHR
jgi:hypothetical protein